MRQRVDGLETPQSIINRTIHDMGPAAEQKYFAHAVMLHWGDIVGNYIAERAEVQAIRQETLYLYCYDATLRNELRMREGDIVQRVNNYAGRALVKSLNFTRKWENPDSEGVAELIAADGTAQPLNFAREMKKISLTEEEIARAKAFGANLGADFEAWGQLFYQELQQARHLKARLGYQPCERCGTLIEPGERLCYSCYRAERDELYTRVRDVLRDMPWARIGDMREFVPECTPKMLNRERAAMVHTLCGRVMAGDTDSIEAKQLVMLYRCLPPEQLTEDVMTRTIYELRFALVKPPDYHAPRRYDVIKLGKKGKGENNVSPPR